MWTESGHSLSVSLFLFIFLSLSLLLARACASLLQASVGAVKGGRRVVVLVGIEARGATIACSPTAHGAERRVNLQDARCWWCLCV